jgi:hypothetical protein
MFCVGPEKSSFVAVRFPSRSSCDRGVLVDKEAAAGAIVADRRDWSLVTHYPSLR